MSASETGKRSEELSASEAGKGCRKAEKPATESSGAQGGKNYQPTVKRE